VGAIAERIREPDADETIAALCAAFHDYPVMRYTLSDAGEAYEERLRGMIGFFCNKRLVRGWPVLGVRVDGEIAGAALINEPGDAPVPGEIAVLRRELIAAIGEPAYERFMRYENESDLDAPRAPHHFLGVIGVRPANQGQGLAAVLLHELARMCDAHPESTGICLNTEDAGNVAFYEHMGYRVLARRRIDDGLETWCMFRASPDR